MVRSLLAGSLALGLCVVTDGARAQEIFVYPTKGQSQQQQAADQAECRAWAVQQTGFDPASPPPPPAGAAPADTGVGLVGGAARGAALGAVGGAIAGDAGEGAAIGAATGALFGGMRKRTREREHRAQEGQVQAQYQAQIAQQQDAFRRASAACLQGRGYTVN
jgi:hypothetical protein